MKCPILALCAYALSSCSSASLNDRELLLKCWAAVPTRSPGEYRLAFEAIILTGTEGGIYARSRRCPDHRLGLDYGNESVRAQFEAADKRVFPGHLGVVVRADGIARIKERKTDYYMTMSVNELRQFEVLPDTEAEAFIRDFHIG